MCITHSYCKLPFTTVITNTVEPPFTPLKGPHKNGVYAGKCKLWDMVYAHKEHLETH
jgi:hypothetical protein